MKHYVKQDCSRRYMKAVLKNSGPIAKPYCQGDLIMYRKEQQGGNWHGPARVLSTDNKVAWCLHHGTSITTLVLPIRLEDAPGILAHMRMSRWSSEPVPQMAAGSHQRFR